MAEVGGFGFQLAKIVGFGFSVSAVKFFQFGSRDDGEVADLFVLMYIMLWALGPITLLVQHTYTCTALYLYRTLMPPI